MTQRRFLDDRLRPRRTWAQVRDAYNARHGTSLSRQRVWQIHQAAIEKLRRRLLEQDR